MKVNTKDFNEFIFKETMACTLVLDKKKYIHKEKECPKCNKEKLKEVVDNWIKENQFE